MKTILLSVVLFACGGGDPQQGPDAMTTNDGQRVIRCSGVVMTNAPSNCPKGDCDERASNVVSCSSYASFIPGSTSGACNVGQTGSYGLLFAKNASDLSTYFYEVVECNGGTATLHACASGFHTDPVGYNGQPGYVCN